MTFLQLTTVFLFSVMLQSPSRSDGLAAWQQIYSVLTSPRCINCHTANDYPQQGDDPHVHLFNVVRGKTDRGVPAFTCATCHQEANADSTGVPRPFDQKAHLPQSGFMPTDTNLNLLALGNSDRCNS